MDQSDLTRRPWSHEDKITLIEMAEKFDVLWNTTYPFYRELTQRKKALEEIKEKLEDRHSLDDINAQWRNLKDVFYKKKGMMEQKQALGQAPADPIWRYYQPLKFLLSCEEERKNILRKRFHGNYELAQLRQMRYRRSQELLRKPERNSNSSSSKAESSGYHLPMNNVVWNAFKGKLKNEHLEDDGVFSLDQKLFSRANGRSVNAMNLDDLADSPPTSSAASPFFISERMVKKEIEEEENDAKNTSDSSQHHHQQRGKGALDDFLGGFDGNAQKKADEISCLKRKIMSGKSGKSSSDVDEETVRPMSANDALLAAISAASTSSVNKPKNVEFEKFLAAEGIKVPKGSSANYNGHYNDNNRRQLVHRYEEWRRRQILSPPPTSHTTRAAAAKLVGSGGNGMSGMVEHNNCRKQRYARDIADSDTDTPQIGVSSATISDSLAVEVEARAKRLTELHFRHCMLYEFDQQNFATAAAKKICEIYGEKSVDERICRHWFKQFRSGNFCLDENGDGDKSITNFSGECNSNSSPSPMREEEEMDDDVPKTINSIEKKTNATATVTVSALPLPQLSAEDSATIAKHESATKSDFAPTATVVSTAPLAEKFKYFSTYVESALLDMNQQSPAIAKKLVQEIYASIAKHQSQLL